MPHARAYYGGRETIKNGFFSRRTVGMEKKENTFGIRLKEIFAYRTRPRAVRLQSDAIIIFTT